MPYHAYHAYDTWYPNRISLTISHWFAVVLRPLLVLEIWPCHDTHIHSVAGVTGARSGLPPGLKDLLGRIRAATDKPLAVGFGITTKEHVQGVAGMADGVVVGSAFMNTIDEV